MYRRQKQRGVPRPQLLCDLGDDVGAVGVSQVDRVGVEHHSDRRFDLARELLELGAKPVGVGKEQWPVDPCDHDCGDRLEVLVTRGLVIGASGRVAS